MTTVAETTFSEDRSTSSGTGLPVGPNIVVDYRTPLPEFDTDGGRAFAASDQREPKARFFAVPLAPTLPFRQEACSAMIGARIGNLVNLVEADVADWPGDRAKRMILVYQRPNGRRVATSVTERREPMPEDVLTRCVIQPLAVALRDMNLRVTTHGSVRPTNLFFREGTSGPVMLGDWVSVPCGYRQPSIFEPVERAVCDPAARGPCSAADDMFAFGATVLWFAVGGHPIPTVSETEILEQRLDRGSYATLCSVHRFGERTQELLRNLLSDEPKARWTAREVEQWLAARPAAQRIPQPPRRAARALELAGRTVWTARACAHALGRDESAAVVLIESGELERWLRRSLADEPRADGLAQTMAAVAYGGIGPGYAERLVSRALTVLDPKAPIRFCGHSFFPTGVGAAMFAAYGAGRSPQVYLDALNAMLMQNWIAIQPDVRPEVAWMAPMLESLRMAIEQTGSGFGVERLMYELVPTGSCLSPMLGGNYVATLPELLKALDTLGSKRTRPNEPIDRHIAAFVLARHKHLDERFLPMLAPSAPPLRRALAMLAIYADSQRMLQIPTLRGLGNWLLPLLRPGIERFGSRTRQQRLSKELERAAGIGDLPLMLSIIDDPKTLQEDSIQFSDARKAYMDFAAEIRGIEFEISDEAQITRTDGRQFAALVAGVIAALVIFVILVIGVGGS